MRCGQRPPHPLPPAGPAEVKQPRLGGAAPPLLVRDVAGGSRSRTANPKPRTDTALGSGTGASVKAAKAVRSAQQGRPSPQL